MRKSLVARLKKNGRLYIIGALILLIGIPLYQFLLLLPQGYSVEQAAVTRAAIVPYLQWIGSHVALYLGARLLLILAFLALVSLPFSLFRIIVAQELVASEEMRNEEVDGDDDEEQEAGRGENGEDEKTEVDEPVEAWRGKGFVVLAAWTGLPGIVLFLLGTLASAIYFAVAGSSLGSHASPPDGFFTIAAILSIIANTIGEGLIALSCFFFGVVIARRGARLWPGVWVAFGYAALVVAALLIVAAVAVAGVPTQSQGTLGTLAVFLFALWVLWLGIMLARLKPEA